MKILNLLISAIFLLVLSGSFTFALSAGGIPGEVEVYAGETVERVILIQNLLAGSTDLTLQGEFEQGSEIVSFSQGRTIEVRANSVVSVPVRIRIPNNVVVGAEYPVLVIFRTISGVEGEGNVQFSTNIGKEFRVIVVEKPTIEEKPSERGKAGAVFGWIIAIVIVILIVWLILRKKKK